MDALFGIRTFAAVAAHGSFTEGAKQLGISPKLASKYVKQLEERQNIQLFHRTTRSVTLTDVGQAYLKRAIPLLDQYDELENVVEGRQTNLAGPIRITAPTGYGSEQLVHHLRSFQAANPEVTLHLQLSDRNVSIIEEGFDLAVRFGPLTDSTLTARKLTDMRIVCCASPDYLSSHSDLFGPKDLSNHNCLLLDSAKPVSHWEFNGPDGQYKVQVTGSFRCNAPRAIANMAADGLGIGRVPLYTAEPLLRAGRLVLLFEAEETRGLGLYAVYPETRHVTARVRRLIDHLASTLSHMPDAQAGGGPENVVR